MKPRIYLESAVMNWPGHMLPLWRRHFDPQPLDQAGPDDCCVYVLSPQAGLGKYGGLRDQPRVELWVWDTPVVASSAQVVNGNLRIHSRDWVWIHEHQLCSTLPYQSQTQPRCNPQHFFLMLMNLARDHRDELRSAVAQYLESSLHSYVERGLYLPGDMPIESHGLPQGSGQHGGTRHDRHYNPQWYTGTAFSLVSETTMNTRIWGWEPDQVFVSEKSYKPLAYLHPSITAGTAGTLAHLQSQGFATWDHVIDQSYDSIADDQQRRAAVVAQLEPLWQEFVIGHCPFSDGESLARIQHNYHRFYDAEHIARLWDQQIAQPILEFLNSP